MKKKYLASLMALTFAHSASALDLMEAYNLALSNDPTFRSAKLDYEAAEANKAIGISALLPKVSASYTNQKNKLNSSQDGVTQRSGYGYNSNYSVLQLTQPLFSLDAYARFKQGSAQADFGYAKFMYNSQDLLIRVLQAYTDLLFARDQLRFQQAERDAFKEQSKLTEKYFQKGEGARTDALESLAAYEVSEAKVAEALDAVQYAKYRFESVIGQPVENLDALSGMMPSFKFLAVNPVKYEEWRDQTLAGSLELKAMEKQIEIANQEHSKNMAGHLPVVSLVAATTHQESNSINTLGYIANQNYVGIQLTMPIFSGGEVKARTSQAYSAYEKAKADYDVTRDKVIAELRKQYDAVQTGAIKVQALGRSLESSLLLVEAMRKSVKSGERVNLDILMAEKNLYTVRRDLAQAKYNYLISFLKLHQQAGSLQPENFQEVAAYFK